MIKLKFYTFFIIFYFRTHDVSVWSTFLLEHAEILECEIKPNGWEFSLNDIDKFTSEEYRNYENPKVQRQIMKHHRKPIHGQSE